MNATESDPTVQCLFSFMMIGHKCLMVGHKLLMIGHRPTLGYATAPESTHEKLSFFLFGMDCRQPLEAAFLPVTGNNALVVSDFREELVNVLSSARLCTTQCIQKAQLRYETQ